MPAEDEMVDDEEEDPRVADEGEGDEGGEDGAEHGSWQFAVGGWRLAQRKLATANRQLPTYSRSRIGPINVSGTRTVPSVSFAFTVPWSSDPPVSILPRKRATFEYASRAASPTLG